MSYITSDVINFESASFLKTDGFSSAVISSLGKTTALASRPGFVHRVSTLGYSLPWFLPHYVIWGKVIQWIFQKELNHQMYSNIRQPQSPNFSPQTKSIMLSALSNVQCTSICDREKCEEDPGIPWHRYMVIEKKEKRPWQTAKCEQNTLLQILTKWYWSAMFMLHPTWTYEAMPLILLNTLVGTW